jgi:hypothetical protein
VIADDIATAITTKLATIRTTNGFATNCGQRVFGGRRAIGPEHVPCVVIFEGDEEIDDGTRHTFKNTTQYVFEGFAVCDPDNPNVAARQIVADIKRAVFTGDLALGGLVHRIQYAGRVIGENVAGTEFVSARVVVKMTFADRMVV